MADIAISHSIITVLQPRAMVGCPEVSWLHYDALRRTNQSPIIIITNQITRVFRSLSKKVTLKCLCKNDYTVSCPSAAARDHSKYHWKAVCFLIGTWVLFGWLLNFSLLLYDWDSFQILHRGLSGSLFFRNSFLITEKKLARKPVTSANRMQEDSQKSDRDH